MTEPNTDELNDHFKRLIIMVLKLDDKEIVESRVHTASVNGSNFIIHLRVMINGQEPTPHQSQAIIAALRHFGLPGIRVTDFHIPAEA